MTPMFRHEFKRVMLKKRGDRFDLYYWGAFVPLAAFFMLQALAYWCGEPIVAPQPAYTMQEVYEQKRLTRERYGVKIEEPFTEEEVAAMVRIAWRESRFNPRMKNPASTSHGLFGFLKGTCESYGPCGGDPLEQTRMALDYVFDRYSTPTKALEFHTTPHIVNGKKVYYY